LLPIAPFRLATPLNPDAAAVRGTGADHVTVDVDCTASSTKLFTGTPDGDVPVPQLG
jgi:hypothetical protein